MKNTLLIALICSLFVSGKTLSQEHDFKPPSGDKAVIYFVRTPGTGAMINFRFFEKGTFLGKFNGTNYLRYECSPGKTLFWVKAENVDYVEADLKSGGIYVIEARPTIGAMSSAVKFKLIDWTDERQVKRISKVMKSESGASFTKEELRDAQVKMQEVINEGIRDIHNKRRFKKKVKVIIPEMTVPARLPLSNEKEE